MGQKQGGAGGAVASLPWGGGSRVRPEGGLPDPRQPHQASRSALTPLPPGSTSRPLFLPTGCPFLREFLREPCGGGEEKPCPPPLGKLCSPPPPCPSAAVSSPGSRTFPPGRRGAPCGTTAPPAKKAPSPPPLAPTLPRSRQGLPAPRLLISKAALSGPRRRKRSSTPPPGGPLSSLETPGKP